MYAVLEKSFVKFDLNLSYQALVDCLAMVVFSFIFCFFSVTVTYVGLRDVFMEEKGLIVKCTHHKAKPTAPPLLLKYPGASSGSTYRYRTVSLQD